MKSVLNILWKDWSWSWNSDTLATWCEELTHLKRPWYWERLQGGGEGDDKGWDGWMASPTQWTRVWPSSGSWWWTGRPGVLQPMGSQRVGHDWATELKPDWMLVFPVTTSSRRGCSLWRDAPAPLNEQEWDWRRENLPMRDEEIRKKATHFCVS